MIAQEVNTAIGIRAEHGELRVLSFGEGRPHSFSGILPRVSPTSNNQALLRVHCCVTHI